MANKLAPHELIQKYGWIQGDVGDKKRGFCFLGALEASYCDKSANTKYFKAVGIAKTILRKKYGNSDIITWNDNRNCTSKEVISVLKQVHRHITKVKFIDKGKRGEA